MASDQDDALRARAAFDENAAELLRLAVERGLISRAEADSAIVDAQQRITQTADGTPEPVLDALVGTGVLDPHTLAGLARELGLPSDAAPTWAGAEESRSSDPFDVPPVSDWDRYEILEFIGRGGMGDVFKARDPRLGRYVALKFLRRDTPEIVHRFLREARVQARIDHDNVCQIFEVGEVEGHPYIAMQYIAGGSLKEIGDLLSIPEKVGVVVDVADALHAAHQAGLIHRDIKPANILVEKDHDGSWRPFVVDFGIAREVESHDVTVSGMVLGTPAFAAPEQVRGEVRKLDRRTDVYSLGATLYWFLTGKPPYEGGYPDVLSGIMERDPMPPHRLDPDIPVDLETITLKCLEKEPDRRYPTARAVSEDLRRLLAREPISARPASPIYKLNKKIRKYPGITVAAAATLLAFAAVVALAVRSNFQARRQSAIAQRFAEQVNEIEGLVRITSMIPRHDRRHEEEMIRGQMGAIEVEMARVGQLGAGPGHYALGRGYLALQRYDDALDHLEQAVAAGYQTPTVDYGLGLVLGKLYEQNLQRVQLIDNEDQRAAYRREIEGRYKEPALAHLRRSSGPRMESAAYAEGLIAFYEQRHEEALELARRAFDELEWLYEAKKLEGDIHLAIGSEKKFRGEYDGALQDFERAGIAYEAAAEIGRSDASVYDGDCARWIQLVETEVRRGAAENSVFDRALDACTRPLDVDPDRADPHERLSRLYWQWADVINDRGGDPTPQLQNAVNSAERAMKLAPASATAHYALGGALLVSGVHELTQGKDPRNTLARAVVGLNAAIERDPLMLQAHDDLGYAHERVARYLLSVGEDPRPSLERAISSFDRAIALDPEYANARNNKGIALWRSGWYELKVGLDPSRSLDEALAAFKAAIELNSNYAYAYANRGLSYRTKALFDLDRGQDPTTWLDLARSNLARAVSINPKIHWAYPERASVELLAARWAMRQSDPPDERLASAGKAAAAAIRLNPQNAAAFQTLAEVHRWRAEWLLSQGKDVQPDVVDGRRMAADALAINPTLANAMVSDAALLLIHAAAATDLSRVQRLVSEAFAALDRAEQVNPLIAREAERLRLRARADSENVP